MSNISIKNLTFAYPSQAALFDNANFELDTSWRLGLLGRNGRGKTTLFKLLQNKLSYTGQLDLPVAVGYFPQPIANKQQLAFYCLTKTGTFEPWKLKRELKLFGLAENLLWRPFETLSNGEQTKLMLCALFCQTDRFLLLDEPTAHLDQASRQELGNYLKQKKQGFIITSHDRNFLAQLIDHTLVIEKKQVILEKGALASYEQQKKRREQTEQAQNKKLKHELHRLKQTALAKENWAKKAEKQKHQASHADKGFIGHRAAKVMKRATSLSKRAQDQLRQKEQQLANLETRAALRLNYRPTHHQRLVQAQNFSLAYEKELFSPVDFEVKAHEIVVITGKNGSGKSSILHALLAKSPATKSGHLALNTQNFSLLTQELPTETGTLKDFAHKRQLDYPLLLTLLKKLLLCHSDRTLELRATKEDPVSR